MSKYKAYPEYKDSGVKWLGDVPSSWNSIPLKLIITTRKGIAFKSSDFTEKGVRVVKASDIKNLSVNLSNVFLMQKFLGLYPKAILREGDIVLSTVGSTPDVKNSAVGQIGIIPAELNGTLLNQNTVVFDPDKNKIQHSYLFHILQMVGYRDHLDLHAHGTANQASLNISDMLNFQSPLPSIEEQTQIANFLDHETAKIDTLIDKQQQLIKLLKEKRQAVISHAVTRGLNPDAPMKDSGVEWLGEVPAHWVICSLRWRINIASGEGISTNLVEKINSSIHCYPVIGGNGVMGFTNKANTIDDAVAIGRVGALCGNVHLIENDSWITDNALKVSLWDDFEKHYFVSLLKTARLNDLASKTAQPLITGEQIKNLKVVIPPLDEQLEINKKIRTLSNHYNAIEVNATKGIELLKERRTALISAAVTGKIDVRHWQAPLANGEVS